MSFQPRQTPSQHVYDLLIVGHDLAGLWSGALLAKKGLKVLLVLEPNAFEVSENGFHFPKESGLWPSFANTSVAGQLLQELQMNAVLAKATRPVHLQLIAKHAWETVFGEDETASSLTAQKTAAEWISATAPLDPFWATLPEVPLEGFWSRFRSKEAEVQARASLLERKTSPTLGAQLETALGWLAAPFDNATFLPARPMAQLWQKPLVFDAGWSRLFVSHLERLQQLGVEIVESPLGTFQFSGHQIVGIQLPKQDVLIRASRVFLSTTVNQIAAMLPEGKRSMLPKPSGGHQKVTHHCVVPKKAIPRGLAPWAVVETDDTQLGAVVLETHWQEHREQALLSFHVRVPLAAAGGDKGWSNRFAERLWLACEHVLPFTQPQVLAESTTLAESTGLFRQPLCDGVNGAQDNVYALPLQSPFKHALFVNRQVLPGLGFEGEAVTARRAVNRCAAELNPKK